ncbi:type IV pilus twitching motility protein PilT [Desulfobotulus sp.]|jgi:pilus retraction protein PilT|uniref:type IV pilus twitching motility protein PilT n=1 Tax=Desulfobotulus sp. TaxID=1940337 RepID=UPI002A36DC9E|nr:ATPase, T2SS/T4P/T4SS family [Desulfobotulus sp.]MDY0163067.1 ATPase, T2SS/T4P/T4SS family [Desulfobotulus sp.]
MENFETLIRTAMQSGYSDLHLTGAHPLVFRKEGAIGFQPEIRFSPQYLDDLANKLLTPREKGMLQTRLSVDLARSMQGVRVRIHVFSTSRGLSFSVRLLPGHPPTLNQLNLHPLIREACRLPKGLVLICGSTGSGKSTTIAAMVDEINHTRSEHIITLEDPIEYRFSSAKSYVEQRELGAHMPSFDQGLRDVLRQDPDVIVVGELREPETIRLTLNAVESGHLVIASLHATHSEDALYRICNSFQPEIQDLVRNQLASTLALLVVQHLERDLAAGFRVPVLSLLRGSSGVKGLIRENRFSQIESAIQMGKEAGMMTQEQYRREYLRQQKNLTPPHRIFRPSPEEVREPSHTSALLVEGPAKQRGASWPSSHGGAGVPSSSRPGTEAESLTAKRLSGMGGGAYEIEEEDLTMSDLLKDL